MSLFPGQNCSPPLERFPFVLPASDIQLLGHLHIETSVFNTSVEQNCTDTFTLFQQLLPKLLGIRRISPLEFLDAVKDLDLVLTHYAITWGLWHPGTETKASWGIWGLKTQFSPGNT